MQIQYSWIDPLFDNHMSSVESKVVQFSEGLFFECNLNKFVNIEDQLHIIVLLL